MQGLKRQTVLHIMEHDITRRIKNLNIDCWSKAKKKGEKKIGCVIWTMLRTPDVKFVGMSHFNNVTSSSSIKEKRAEKVVKKNI